ncbi:MAG: SIS domain-containing protein, partial [Oscillospiraceae bacterium]|nr:SIS domain-containing protein [Oscillospiraceae bacterium]
MAGDADHASVTGREAFAQYAALDRTFGLFAGRLDDMERAMGTRPDGAVCFIGCGSSYCLAKSAALALGRRARRRSMAFAAGDALVNYDSYAGILRDATLVTLSRSGSTSEVVDLVTRAKADYGAPHVAVCANTGSRLSALADLCMEMPWAFDEAVCQTRCVTNLYLAAMMAVAALTGDGAMVESLGGAVADGERYMAEWAPRLKAVAEGVWDTALVLADGAMGGIAEEGALAFVEICRLHSNFHNLLDVRHGPMVKVGGGTLAIAALSDGDMGLQAALLRDLKAKGATVVAFCAWDADAP